MGTARVFGATASQPSFSNICLNPRFNTVLPGTHTSAIRQNNVASTILNHEMPGWRSQTGSGSPDITVTRDTSTVTGDATASAKILVTTQGSSTNVFECPLNDGEAPAIDDMLYSARGKYVTFAADVKQSASTSSACRISITDGIFAATTTYSSYHGANTDWERLIVSAEISSTSASVQLELNIENITSSGDFFNMTNCMAVVADAPLPSLAFVPRGPMDIRGIQDPSSSTAATWSMTAPSDTNFHETTDSGEFATTYDNNANRPAWATAVALVIQSGGTTNALVGVGPNGQSDAILFCRPQNADGRGSEAYGVVNLAQDGQLAAKVSNTSNDIHGYQREYTGDGL